MRRLIPLICCSLGLCGLAKASPYDYPSGSMAQYYALQTDNAMNSYSVTPNSPSDFESIRASLEKSLTAIFAKPSQSRYSEPDLPQGSDNWTDYWDGYQEPTYTYTPPVVVDTRTPQEVLIDAAKDGNTVAMWNLGHDYIGGNEGFAQSAESGIYWLKTAFEHGNIEAGDRLFAYFDPDYFAGESTIKKDPIQSLYWLRKAAKAGWPESMRILGGRTLQGAGVDANPTEGLRLLKAAVDAGDTTALIDLEYSYENGWGVPQDLGEAIKWQRQFVGNGVDGDHISDLIGLLVRADDPKNRAHTDEIKELIARAPDNQLQLLHAKLADAGVLGTPDPALCISLCQKIIANNELGGGGRYSITEAKFLLADHFVEGRGAPKDEIAAYKLYRSGLESQSFEMPVKSQFYYAMLLDARLKTKKDDGTWVVIDEPKTALPLLLTAQDSEELTPAQRARAAFCAAGMLAAHPELQTDFPAKTVADELEMAQQFDPQTTLQIAFGTRLGWYGTADKDKSRELAKKAIDEGNPKGLFWLARWSCEDSNGTDPHWKAQMETVLRNNDGDAVQWMSDQLASGKLMPKDLTRSLALLRTAAAQGQNAQAQNNLGVALWRGDLGVKDVPAGLDWMQKSLDGGLWDAGRNLAKIYHLGLGVPKDEVKAKAYLEKAGQIGGVQAAKVLADAYMKGDIIDPDSVEAMKWTAIAEH